MSLVVVVGLQKEMYAVIYTQEYMHAYIIVSPGAPKEGADGEELMV